VCASSLIVLGVDGRCRTYSESDGLASMKVNAVAVDANTGDKWFGTDRGVTRLSADGHWETHHVAARQGSHGGVRGSRPRTSSGLAEVRCHSVRLSLWVAVRRELDPPRTAGALPGKGLEKVMPDPRPD